MKKYFYLILFIGLWSCANKTLQSLEPVKISFVGYEWLGDLYRPSRTVRDSIFEKKGNQMGAWFYSNIENHQAALTAWDAGRTDTVRGLTPEESALFATYSAFDAHKFIVQEARNHEILIVNEAHHVAQHRVFVTDLLRDLYREGYRHIGFETLMSDFSADSTLNARKFPTLQSGVYSSEPQFANLVRTALRLGFTVFSYESKEAGQGLGPRDREIAQAKNIQNFLENRAKEGKTLIYCGGAHATEGEMGGKWEKAMVQRLKDLLKIDALTVNQSNYSERSKKQFENKYYQAVEPKNPTVFIDEKGQSFGEKSGNTWHDIYVFHPRTRTTDRPQWLVFGNRKKVKIELNATEIKYPCLVLAYKMDEFNAISQPVPYDIQEVLEPENGATLVLEKGVYQMIIVNADGKKVKKKMRF
ncbi:MAG: hypothetical protein RL757_1747 [Bacteroidota bacterium]|jgi:hypothetical protein